LILLKSADSIVTCLTYLTGVAGWFRLVHTRHVAFPRTLARNITM